MRLLRTAAVLFLLPVLASCGASEITSGVNLPAELVIEDLVVGTGTGTVVRGDVVSVNYVGALADGTVFQRSTTPFQFQVGVTSVISGFELGVLGMRTGGKRKVTMPPDWAYGSNPPAGSGIPPNATLVFEIEMVSIVGK